MQMTKDQEEMSIATNRVLNKNIYNWKSKNSQIRMI